MFEDILTTIVVIGAIIILLQVMILISIWRRGSKYSAMERVYRERQAEVNAKEDQRRANRLFADWDVDEENGHENLTAEDIQAALDDTPRI